MHIVLKGLKSIGNSKHIKGENTGNAEEINKVKLITVQHVKN